MVGFFRTVSGKLLLATGTAIATIVLIYSGYTGWQSSQRVNQQVMELATERAGLVAQRVAVQITEATAAGSALSGSISGYIETGNASRSSIIGMISGVPSQYENLFGAWMSGVPGSSLNDLLTGVEGMNEDSVFTPFWTKTNSGELSFSTFDVAVDQQWYSPALTGERLITEPYLTVTNDLLTSVAVPLIINDEILGVVGVDIGLGDLTAVVSDLIAFEGGQTYLVDNGSKWLTNPDADNLMKPYGDVGQDLVSAALGDGQPRVIHDMPDGSTRLIYPFTAPGMNTTWAAILDVPSVVFTAPVRSEIATTAISGALVLIMALATVYFASTAMVRRPLSQMLETVNDLASGVYDKSVPGADRHDEIGAMAGSVECLRQSLVEKDELEATQERMRIEAESERVKREAEDTRILEEREARRVEDLEREKQQAATKEEARRKEEAERTAREAEQAKVVETLAAGLKGLATGNLDVELREAFAGGYDQLRLDFNDAVERLSNLIRSISGSTGSIAGGVNEIASASTDLSHRTETSAATLEETAAALNELTAAVRSAADGARQVDELVRGADDKAQTTSHVVNEAVTAMGAINASSDQITQIIKVIDDIAFQTNLLALNAGVEAARAGDAGRGFAVVASEVRALAQRSSEAARDINALISESGSQVKHGVELVGQAGEALQSITTSIADISQHVSAIATSADEQATGIDEINTAVGQLDHVQQQNAAMFEETTAACMALTEDASGLEELVGQFRIAATASSSTQKNNEADYAQAG